MDESYFRPFLEPLGNQYEIIFYRQLRVPFKTDDGLNELLRQLDDIVNSLNNSSGMEFKGFCENFTLLID